MKCEFWIFRKFHVALKHILSAKYKYKFLIKFRMTHYKTHLSNVLVLELLGPRASKGQEKHKVVAEKQVFQYCERYYQDEFLECLWCLQESKHYQDVVCQYWDRLYFLNTLSS